MLPPGRRSAENDCLLGHSPAAVVGPPRGAPAAAAATLPAQPLRSCSVPPGFGQAAESHQSEPGSPGISPSHLQLPHCLPATRCLDVCRPCLAVSGEGILI